MIKATVTIQDNPETGRTDVRVSGGMPGGSFTSGESAMLAEVVSALSRLNVEQKAEALKKYMESARESWPRENL